MRSLQLSVLVTIAVASGGCTSAEEQYQSDLDAALAPHRARLESLRANLGLALRAARERPALTPLASPWTGAAITWRGSSATAIAINDDHALDAPYPSGGPPIDGPEHFAPWSQQEALIAIAHGHTPPFEDEYTAAGRVRVIGATAASSAALSHAVICHTLSESMPSVDAGRLVPGEYTAECRVFELDEARYLGGFTVHGESGDTERVVTGSGAGSTVAGQLRGHIGDAAASQAFEALRVTGTPSADEIPF